jgi:hypothetical protein
MILDDGKGEAINTSPPSLETKIRNLGVELTALRKAIRAEGRTKKRQTMQAQFDSWFVRYKKLIKELEKKNGKGRNNSHLPKMEQTVEGPASKET